MFCQNCGNQDPNVAAYCGRRGTSIGMEPLGGYNDQIVRGNGYASYSAYKNERISVDPNTALRTLTSKLRTSANIWTAIGIYQIVAGLMLLIFGYGRLSLIQDIWNIMQSSKSRKMPTIFRRIRLE